MQSCRAIGLMSGTSLDGIDIAFVFFQKDQKKWKFKLGPFTSLPYNRFWKNRLKNLINSSALEYVKTHAEYGHFLGKQIANFIKENGLKVDLIASHGHTVFHQPEKGFTSQLGSGAAIAVETGITVVCDFRSMDVARSGQGAPLVPIGDALLFNEYKVRINLGGFSNFSMNGLKKLLAFDICASNIVLNHLAERLKEDFDNDGNIARGGQLIPELLKKLNKLEYYNQTGPKSLGVEWVEKEIFPLLSPSHKVEDLLRTYVEHIAVKISTILNAYCADSERALFTGGGVYNSFLMERISKMTQAQIEIPAEEIVEMKEAIIFAFLGLLRLNGEENILGSYTGACNNSISGAVYKP
jgi:anhydro-N-acetylmuramic acid kinase